MTKQGFKIKYIQDKVTKLKNSKFKVSQSKNKVKKSYVFKIQIFSDKYQQKLVQIITQYSTCTPNFTNVGYFLTKN